MNDADWCIECIYANRIARVQSLAGVGQGVFEKPTLLEKGDFVARHHDLSARDFVKAKDSGKELEFEWRNFPGASSLADHGQHFIFGRP
jgi:hypothetical protein